MRWEDEKQTKNFEDRTNDKVTSGGDLGDILGGLGGGSGSGRGGIGLPGGGLLGIIIILAMLFLGGGNLGSIFGDLTGTNTQQQTAPKTSQKSKTTMGDSTDTRKAFSRTVFQMLDDFWGPESKEYGINYQSPTLVIYSGKVQTPFGVATSDMGPFYSPSDQKVYLDTSFQDELANTYGSKGDYTMAYVLAHEFGHHIQNRIGLASAMGRLQQQLSKTEYNKYSVCMELQADYYAGVWTKYLESRTTTKGEAVLEQGDIEEAIKTASVIGDDFIQKKFTGQVNPETFTHGSSADRVKYFNLGYKYGDLEHGDVFADKGLRNPVGTPTR